ncbi:hypothetical protein QTP81_09920 [Alteromonas sp. ASW11-36]|uniref:Uncharacterized protein n=1 Tax=Alteromonas arenosi TaxID=3055817 RepID=A0ABT7SZE4_9ALTE|nr:hypothetical protein [Alteromonas sp. ASW11-36]MDM7860912.1 hypothetical protein [Alteromonas sp. ASW11-36]
MQELTPNYIIAVAEQLSFVSAFLGGISTTILVTIVVFTSPKKSVSWIVSTSTLAACSLLIAVVASWRLTILLHPEIPITVNESVIMILWAGMLIGYGLGFLSLLVSIGLSGWMRSKKSGIITTCIASVAVVFFVVATPFGL